MDTIPQTPPAVASRVAASSIQRSMPLSMAPARLMRKPEGSVEELGQTAFDSSWIAAIIDTVP